MKLQYRKVNIEIYDKNNKYHSRLVSILKLDSRKYDNIGWTEESLDEYLRTYILANGESYLIIFDKIYNKN